MAAAKFEFLSPEWIAMAREEITRALAGKDLRHIRFTLCEEFTNPPNTCGRKGPTASASAFDWKTRG